jgi:hypothetical protein
LIALAESQLQNHLPMKKSRLSSINDFDKGTKVIKKENISQQMVMKESELGSLALEIDQKNIELSEILKRSLNFAYELLKCPEELW